MTMPDHARAALAAPPVEADVTAMKSAAAAWFETLRDRILAALETLESEAAARSIRMLPRDPAPS